MANQTIYAVLIEGDPGDSESETFIAGTAFETRRAAIDWVGADLRSFAETEKQAREDDSIHVEWDDNVCTVEDDDAYIYARMTIVQTTLQGAN